MLQCHDLVVIITLAYSLNIQFYANINGFENLRSHEADERARIGQLLYSFACLLTEKTARDKGNKFHPADLQIYHLRKFITVYILRRV